MKDLEENETVHPSMVTTDEVQAVLDELDQLEIDDEGVADSDEYDRQVTIWFPQEAADEFGKANLSLPKREVLRWFADNHPEEREWALALRDAFYSGDDEEDCDYMIDRPSMLPPSVEELAVRRVARASTQAARAKKREELEAAEQERAASERRMWAPFDEERKILEAEREEWAKRWQRLQSDWDTFVVDREFWGEDRAQREAAVRAELAAVEAALTAEAEVWSSRWGALLERVHRQANPQSKAA